MRNYECLYENLMSNNFRKKAVRKKKMTCKLKLKNKGLYSKNWWGGRVPVLKFLQRLALVSFQKAVLGLLAHVTPSIFSVESLGVKL